MIQLAVFDIAGTTLYDPDGVGRCLKSALTSAGVPWTHEALNGMMGIPKPVVIDAVLNAARMDGSVDEIHQDFRRRMLDYYAHDPEVREIEGASETFATLRAAGVKVALDTGFDRSIVEAILDRLGWRDKVDVSVASDEVERGRPEPDLVYRAMSLTGIDDVKRVAKIGDTPSDLGEGTSAGCEIVIGVTYGTHTREELVSHPHSHLAANMNEIQQILLSAK